MSRLPSASALPLAATCPGSQAIPAYGTAFDAGARGTALGAYLDARATGTSEAIALAALDEEHHDSAALLEECVPALEGWWTEAAYGWNHETGEARYIGRHVGREYNAGPAEFVGAADFATMGSDCVKVVDLKCGHGGVAPPGRNLQVRFLALAMCRFTGMERAHVGLILAPEGEKPRWQWAELDAFELASVEEELRDVARRVTRAREAVAKGELPQLTVGDHCRWCKSRWQCPAEKAMAMRIAGKPEDVINDLKSMLDERTAGLVYQRAKAFKHLLDGVFASIYAFARETPVALGDGRMLGPKETRREILDGPTVYECVKVLHGPEVALRCVSIDATKAGLSRALKELPGPTAPKVEAVLSAVRAAGGAEVKVSQSVGEVET